jgi:hypothetical protein
MNQKENNSKHWHEYSTDEIDNSDELEEQFLAHCRALKTYYKLKEEGVSYFDTDTVYRLMLAYESLWHFAHKEQFRKADLIKKVLMEFKETY